MHDSNNPALHHLCEIRTQNAVSQKVMAVFFLTMRINEDPGVNVKKREKKALHL